VSFETSIPVDDVIQGSLTVFCDKLTGILSSLPDGDITVEQGDGKVVMRSAVRKVRFHLKTLSAASFPELSKAEENQYFAVPSREFKKMVVQTIFSVSTDETRYFMNGVFIEKTSEGSMVMVATDGRRLAYVKNDLNGAVPDFRPVIVPTKVLGILVKHLSDEGMISIAVNEKSIFFRFNTYMISSVLIEGTFPNYQKVIPQGQNHSFTVRKIDLLEALKRVSIFVEQKSNRTYFSLSDSGLVVSSEETEIGAAREEIPCEYSGEDTAIALNYRYVEEPLRVLESETLKIEFSDPARAITLKPEPEGDYFHIIMPMQID